MSYENIVVVKIQEKIQRLLESFSPATGHLGVANSESEMFEFIYLQVIISNL